MDSSALVLSSPLSVEYRKGQDGTFDQAPISDPHKLPLELRQKIYKLVLFSRAANRVWVARAVRRLRNESRDTTHLSSHLFGSQLRPVSPDEIIWAKDTSIVAAPPPPTSSSRWLRPFLFKPERRGVKIYCPLMCNFDICLDTNTTPPQIDRLVHILLLNAARPIIRLHLEIVIIVDSAQAGASMIRAVVSILGGVIRNVRDVKITVLNSHLLADNAPEWEGLIKPCEAKMKSSEEDCPVSRLPGMYWAMGDLVKEHKNSGFGDSAKDTLGKEKLPRLRELMEMEDEGAFLALRKEILASVREPNADEDVYKRVLGEYTPRLGMSTRREVSAPKKKKLSKQEKG